MDVSDDGINILWLRVMWRAHPTQRQKVNGYMTRWIRQVRQVDRYIAKLMVDGEGTKVRVR